ncbi:hypothetical protein BASA81_008395 [Batrachochytrium salamandrivorans]|nr:hypothetical protein BASA81_008395 [Batrachochytrium salamandrivorans]
MSLFSPHALVEDRLEELMGLDSGPRVAASRVLCGDETCPPALREKALLYLDGSELAGDFALATACCVETCPFRQEAIPIATRLFPGDLDEYLAWLGLEMQAKPDRVWLNAIWGLQSLPRVVKLVTTPLDLVDFLASLAGKEVLEVLDKRELMGSWKIESLAGLALRAVGWLLPGPDWFQSALSRYLDFPLRSLAVVAMFEENTTVSLDLKKLVLCEAIQTLILTDAKLKVWNQLWFWKQPVGEDEALVQYALHFAMETLPLFRQLCAGDLARADGAVRLRTLFLASSLASNGGVATPWKTRELSQVADELLANNSEMMVIGGGFDLEEVRNRLGNDKWKEDWVATPAFLRLAVMEDSVWGGVEETGAHLVAILLPLMDDVDPRVSAPAWHAMAYNVRAGRVTNQLPLVKFTLERSLTCRDEVVFSQVAGLYKAIYASPTLGGGGEEEERKLVELVSRDAFYSAHSSPALYCIAIRDLLLPAIQRVGVRCIPLTDVLLKAVEAGAQRHETNSFALALLHSILLACEPRIRAHRGRILALFLRIMAIAPLGPESERGFACFVTAVDDQTWIDSQLAKVREAAPGLAAKFL